VPFGPKLSAGDVVTVELDLAKGTVAFRRNRAMVSE
jgi:translation initiation factor IF-1